MIGVNPNALSSRPADRAVVRDQAHGDTIVLMGSSRGAELMADARRMAARARARDAARRSERPLLVACVLSARNNQRGDMAGHKPSNDVPFGYVCPQRPAIAPMVGRPSPASGSSRRNRCTRVFIDFARWQGPGGKSLHQRGSLVERCDGGL